MHQFTIHPSSIILHHIITSPHHPIIQLPACKKSAKICEKNLRKSARNSSSHHHIITSPHHPTSNMQKICEKLIIPSSLHNSITSIDEKRQIEDLTTYIDPVKFNYIFADTNLDAMNFWVQTRFGIKVRRLISAKQIPNL